jgi:hypothetical protein
MKYYLSVGAIFKNESMILKEWIEHYLHHGFEHIYLINDNSTDNFIEILEPYIKSNIITLFHSDVERTRWRQGVNYDKYFKDILKDTFWFGIFDIDEYLYSPFEIDIKKILKNYEDKGRIVSNWAWFGTNGCIEQPKSIVESLTKRAPFDFKQVAATPYGDDICSTHGWKSILNTNFNIKSMDVHGSDMDGPVINLSWESDMINPILIINHYSLISVEYWTKVKMTRGDVNCWFTDNARDLKWLKHWDINTEEDFSLYNQNKPLFQKNF